jgi:hypothetical protein
MLSPTASFNALRIRPNVPGKLVLKLVLDSDTYWLSNNDFSIGATFIYGLIKDWGNIEHAINLLKKTYNYNTVNLKIDNTPYAHTGSAWKMFTDELGSKDYVNRDAYVYLYLDGLTSTDDLLQIFHGHIKSIQGATPESFTLPLADASSSIHIKVPKTLIDSTTYPDAPLESIGKPLPLLYGEFDVDKEIVGHWAEAAWISPTKLVLADSVVESISTVWLWDDRLRKYIEIDSSEYTATVDDSGLATITLNDVDQPLCWAYLYPNQCELILGDTDIFDGSPDYHKAYDQDEMTGLVYKSDPGTTESASLYFYFEPLDALAAINPTTDGTFLEVKARAENTGDISSAVMHFMADNSAIGADIDLSGETYDPESTPQGDYTQENISVDWAADGIAWEHFGKDGDDRAYIYVHVATDANGASTRTVLSLYEIRLKIRYRPTLHPGVRIFAECKGREYGAWINGSRTNDYNSGDPIDNPAFIIEDILRRDLGLADADIDEGAFDSVSDELSSATVDMELAFSLIEQVDSLKLIEEICRQSTVNYSIGGDSKHTVQVLNIGSVSYSADDTLLAEHIKRIELSDTKESEIINKIKYSFGYDKMLREWRKSDESENSTSQTTYNVTKELDIKASMILDNHTIKVLVGTHIDTTVPTVTGYWKDKKPLLLVELLCWENIDWEALDIIQVDSGVGAFIKNFGSAWNDDKFLVIKKIISANSLRFLMRGV